MKQRILCTILRFRKNKVSICHWIMVSPEYFWQIANCKLALYWKNMTFENEISFYYSIRSFLYLQMGLMIVAAFIFLISVEDILKRSLSSSNFFYKSPHISCFIKCLWTSLWNRYRNYMYNCVWISCFVCGFFLVLFMEHFIGSFERN